MVDRVHELQPKAGDTGKISREDPEAARAAGETLHLDVLNLASRIVGDVTPKLARATIGSLVVLGALHASPAVKVAPADRIT
jgi:hypothetical protein